MRSLRPAQYDALERAILDGRRVALRRRGSEHIVIPRRIVAGDREALEVTHPTTGELMIFVLDELDSFEIVA
jgi:hypothetical protein